jgi:hypothetical protein
MLLLLCYGLQLSGADDAARAAFVSKCMHYLAAPAQYLQSWSRAVTTDAGVTEKSVAPAAQVNTIITCLHAADIQVCVFD